MFFSDNVFDGENWNAHYSTTDLEMFNLQTFKTCFPTFNDTWALFLDEFFGDSAQFTGLPEAYFATFQPDKMLAYLDWYFKGFVYGLTIQGALTDITINEPRFYNFFLQGSIFQQRVVKLVDSYRGVNYVEMIPKNNVQFNSVTIICKKIANPSKVGIAINGQFIADVFPGEQITLSIDNIVRVDWFSYTTDFPLPDLYFSSKSQGFNRQQLNHSSMAYTGKTDGTVRSGNLSITERSEYLIAYSLHSENIQTGSRILDDYADSFPSGLGAVSPTQQVLTHDFYTKIVGTYTAGQLIPITMFDMSGFASNSSLVWEGFVASDYDFDGIEAKIMLMNHTGVGTYAVVEGALNTEPLRRLDPTAFVNNITNLKCECVVNFAGDGTVCPIPSRLILIYRRKQT